MERREAFGRWRVEMMLEMKIASSLPHFSQEHFLFGRNYILEFEWLEREEAWVMHFYDEGGKPIEFGLRITKGWPIVVEHDTGMVLFLYASSPRAKLDRFSLHKDFVLIAYELI